MKKYIFIPKLEQITPIPSWAPPLLLIIMAIGGISAIISGKIVRGCHEVKIYNQLNKANFSCMDMVIARDQLNNKTTTLQVRGIEQQQEEPIILQTPNK